MSLSLIERAGRYVSAMPQAVSGSGGHAAAFNVAVALIHGFALSEDEAWPILLSFNERCSPPWNERELRHKLADADKLGSHWNDFRTRMLICRDMHRRNEILIMRKLDAIRGALESLNVHDPASPVEVYDRLGQIKRIRRLRSFTEV